MRSKNKLENVMHKIVWTNVYHENQLDVMNNLLVVMLAGKKTRSKWQILGFLQHLKEKLPIMLLSVSLVFCFSTLPVSTYYTATPNMPPLANALLNLGCISRGINFWFCLAGSELFKRIEQV